MFLAVCSPLLGDDASERVVLVTDARRSDAIIASAQETVFLSDLSQRDSGELFSG